MSVYDNIDNAIALAAKYHHTLRIVTTEGELLNPGGSMSGGAFKNNNNLLGRRRQIKQLEEDVEKFKTKLTEYAAQIEQGEKEIKELREKRCQQQTKTGTYSQTEYGKNWL